MNVGDHTIKDHADSPITQENSSRETQDWEEKDDQTRLHKVLAHRGVASRRKAEQLIASGLVSVNGVVVTEPGSRVNPENDHILVEGKMLPREPEPFLFLFYKPKAVVSTLHDPEGRPTIRDYFPNIDPLLHIGRLDYQTEGVLLLTNNGDLSQRILHPRFSIPRTYLVKVQGGISPGHLERIASGDVKIDGRPVEPLEFVPERNTETNAWYRITLTEGRNREVRRLFETLNYFVLKLVRTAFGPLTLAGLDPGEYRAVTPSELNDLLAGNTPAAQPKSFDSRYKGQLQGKRKPIRRKQPTSFDRSSSSENDRQDRSGSGSDRPARAARPSSFDRNRGASRPDRDSRPFQDRKDRPSFSKPERTFRDRSSENDRQDTIAGRVGRSEQPSRSDKPGKADWTAGRTGPDKKRSDEKSAPFRKGGPGRSNKPAGSRSPRRPPRG